jgi:hypothetical protein
MNILGLRYFIDEHFRFTELFVDELEDTSDLKILVCDYLQGLSLTAGQVNYILDNK